MQVYEQTAISKTVHHPKAWEQFVDYVYSILKHKH